MFAGEVSGQLSSQLWSHIIPDVALRVCWDEAPTSLSGLQRSSSLSVKVVGLAQSVEGPRSPKGWPPPRRAVLLLDTFGLCLQCQVCWVTSRRPLDSNSDSFPSLHRSLDLPASAITRASSLKYTFAFLYMHPAGSVSREIPSEDKPQSETRGGVQKHKSGVSYAPEKNPLVQKMACFCILASASSYSPES